VGASDTTVHARNKHLLNSGINNKFIISVNNNGLNRDMHKKSLTIPQTVMKFLEMHGRFDLLLKLRARNLEQMRDILVNSNSMELNSCRR
jgi:Lrp/AsnC family transcriptional regulator, regulator for asnA, asnC and gidA